MPELPTFNSDRFVIAPLSEGDCHLFVRLYSSQKVMRNAGGAIEGETLKRRFNQLLTTMAAERPRQWFWTIRCRETKECAGLTGISRIVERPRHAELGIVLFPVMQNRGVAQEVLPFPISFAFRSLGMTGIIASHHPSHEAVPFVLVHLGFVVLPEDSTGDREEKSWLLTEHEFLSN